MVYFDIPHSKNSPYYGTLKTDSVGGRLSNFIRNNSVTCNMEYAAAEASFCIKLKLGSAILQKNEWPESVEIKWRKDKESKIKINKKF